MNKEANFNCNKINTNKFDFTISEYLEEEIEFNVPTALKIKIEGKINGENIVFEAKENLEYIKELTEYHHYPWKELKIKEMLFSIITDGLKLKVIKYD